MVTYEALVAARLRQGVMPAWCRSSRPLRSAARSPAGIDPPRTARLVHDTVLEPDVLLGDGASSPSSPRPTSTRTSSSASPSPTAPSATLRVKAKTLPVKPHVHLFHLDYFDGRIYFQELERRLNARDRLRRRHGVRARQDKVSSPWRISLDKAPYVSDYTLERASTTARSPRATTTTSRCTTISALGHRLSRCSKNVLAQNRFVRKFLYGRKRLDRASTPGSCAGTAASASPRRSAPPLGLHSNR